MCAPEYRLFRSSTTFSEHPSVVGLGIIYVGSIYIYIYNIYGDPMALVFFLFFFPGCRWYGTVWCGVGLGWV